MAKPPQETNSRAAAAIKKSAKQMLGNEAYQQTRTKFNEISKEQVSACWKCGKSEGQLGPGKELRCCVGCKAIGRTIKYCSRYYF
jgi:hypothetical protein